jgi:hypothetical protein
VVASPTSGALLLVSDSPAGSGVVVSAVVSSVWGSSDLAWAPPARGAGASVDFVDVDLAAARSDDLVDDESADESLDFLVDVSEDSEADSDDDDSDEGVSAHATPDPVTSAAPIPRATAKPATRPTHAAECMPFAIRPCAPRLGGFRKSAMLS